MTKAHLSAIVRARKFQSKSELKMHCLSDKMPGRFWHLQQLHTICGVFCTQICLISVSVPANCFVNNNWLFACSCCTLLTMGQQTVFTEQLEQKKFCCVKLHLLMFCSIVKCSKHSTWFMKTTTKLKTTSKMNNLGLSWGSTRLKQLAWSSQLSLILCSLKCSILG